MSQTAMNGVGDGFLNRPFKQRRSFAQRKRDVEDILEKYNDKIPCVIERYANEKRLPRLDRSKFLVSEYLVFGQLLQTIRSRLELHPEQAFFLLVNQRSMPPNTMTMSEIYEAEKDEDGYLYIVYASQEVFGGETASDQATSTLSIPGEESPSEGLV